MKENIGINELKEKIQQLESSIEEQCKTFYNETGLFPQIGNVQTTVDTKLGKQVVSNGVSVSVELKN